MRSPQTAVPPRQNNDVLTNRIGNASTEDVGLIIHAGGPFSKLNVLYCPIFRVPEYSELSIVSALGAHEFRSVELVGSEYSALPI
jgi:hypothetical protein